MSFDKQVSEDALVASERCCCLCHTFCGSKIELHHIKQKAEGGEDTLENCIPLCFNCHAEVKAYNPKHPKGKMYTESELIRHRDNWYEKVKKGFKTPINYEPSKLDYELFQTITVVFGNSSLQYYLTEFDFGADFDNSVFKELYNLEYSFKKPEFEFIDSELEKLKGNLANSISTFSSFKAVNTFRTDHGTQAIRAWFNNYDFYDTEDMKIVDGLNDLATDIWNNYTSLVRECRRKFAYLQV
ncbi:HNH endonuclease signature motif containing protein [Tissierella sp. Yu-01]|uniref:HNH endonuclease n=1 Tax=Tissierella sp. Yu-01 TaxID=3035694 RepID=UPI00240D9806|nr:HNH endonuclease signature motif containing protein [Tissierella sp. Yu-01]WFA07621.1 HNH endonuclease signature motif containing protein [Tissierella sp. Yu-01]